MKRFFTLAALSGVIGVIGAIELIGLILVPGAMALSDAEYRDLKKNSAFVQADQALNAAWTEAKNALSPYEFEKLKDKQKQWIAKGRDADAKMLMSLNKLSKADAYASVTNVWAESIRQYVAENASPYDMFVNSLTQYANEISKGKYTDQDHSQDQGQDSSLRAWRGQNYILIREYAGGAGGAGAAGNSSYLARFWIADSGVVFANNLKVGSSLEELRNFFENNGDRGDLSDDTYSVGANKQWVEFRLKNNHVVAIYFVQADCVLTPKMEKIIAPYESR